MINWKNTAENLGLSLISIIVGVVIGYKVSVTTAEKMLHKQKELIELAIKKETTSINNSVTTEISKVKSRKSEPINIVIDPTTNSAISNKDSVQFVPVEEKEGFFKRLFSKKQKP